MAQRLLLKDRDYLQIYTISLSIRPTFQMLECYSCQQLMRYSLQRNFDGLAQSAESRERKDFIPVGYFTKTLALKHKDYFKLIQNNVRFSNDCTKYHRKYHVISSTYSQQRSHAEYEP